MHAVQQPLHASALEEVMGTPAWKSLPSWFLVAEGDQAIPPDAERQFAARMGATTTEVPTNHVAMVSHPDEVVTIIETAAAAVPIATCAVLRAAPSSRAHHGSRVGRYPAPVSPERRGRQRNGHRASRLFSPLAGE
jgi:hypothetical protein